MLQTSRHQSNKLFALLSPVLLFATAVFILTLTVKVGFSLADIFSVPAVEAAPGDVTPASPTTAPADATPVLTTSTPHPTSTPMPTATMMPTPVPVDPYLIVEGSGVNVRSGPGLDYDKIDLLLPGSEAVIVGYNADWWAVDINGVRGWIFKDIVTAFGTQDVPEVTAPVLPVSNPTEVPQETETPPPVWAIDEGHWIDVDLSEQRLTAYEGMTAVKSYLVSTGLPQTPTPVGQYRIWIKFEKDDMAGADYYIKDVPWVMYFHEGYGLHGVTWHANFGHQMSHGCVNQPNDMAEWLFNFSSVGTLVNIHE